MANWQRKIKLNPWWDQAADGEIAIQTLASQIAQKLHALTPLGDEDIDWQRTELADQFNDLAQDHDADRQDFDCLMAALYDWGDTPLDDQRNGRKVCWIDTMSPVSGALR